MQNEYLPLTAYSEDQRQKAMDIYRLIEQYLYHGKSLKAIAKESDLSIRTIQYWVSKYQQFGLKGLIRKNRSDSGIFKVEKVVLEEIRNLILKQQFVGIIVV